MYYGAQYYRPPFPYRTDWERDIRRMSELHFNVVKLWAVWNWIERQPGEFDFSDLDELVSLCERHGLQVIINTIPEGAPHWTQGMEGSFYQTAQNEILRYSGPANIPTAGWPGLCLDSAEAKTLVERFIYTTASHFAQSKAVVAIDVWNEPHLEPMFDYSGQLLCYCAHSVAAFRAWLTARYKTIDALNTTWFRSYTDWDQVQPPLRFGTSADMIDWRRFWLYNLADWMKLRANAARRGAPGKIIQSHVAFSGYMGALNRGGLGNELGDEFLLVESLDAFGLSSFPLWLMGEEHVFGHLINAEIVASAAGSKPYYQVELQGGAGKAGLLGGLVPSATDVRLWNWDIIAAGGKGAVYWQYAPEPAGMESPGFGLIDTIGGDTPRLLSASACAQLFNKEYLTQAERVLSVNGIYLSRTSDLIAYAAKEEEKYNASFVGIYRALYDQGVPVRFVHADHLESALCDGLRTLYLPMTLGLSAREHELLLQFAEQGGKLIVEGCTGIYGENGEMDLRFSFLGRLFGMEHVQVEAIQSGSVRAMGDGFEFGCANYRQTFTACADDTVTFASFADGLPAAKHRKLGKGEAIWLAGFVGADYLASRSDFTANFLAELFDTNGYALWSNLSANRLLVRLLKSGEEYYAVVVNHSGKSKTFSAQIKNGKRITVCVPPENGVIVSCEL